jgi:hypothetical protein
MFGKRLLGLRDGGYEGCEFIVLLGMGEGRWCNLAFWERGREWYEGVVGVTLVCGTACSVSLGWVVIRYLIRMWEDWIWISGSWRSGVVVGEDMDAWGGSLGDIAPDIVLRARRVNVVFLLVCT